MPWTLCEKTDVVAITPILEASLKDEWSEMVEDLIRQHMRLPNLGLSVVITNEYHNGDGSKILKVKAPPIVSVQAVKIEGSAMASGDYVVFGNFIKLRYSSFPVGDLNVTINYTSGSTSVPGQVRLCAASMIVAINNYYGRGGADASLKWADPEKKAGEDDPNSKVGLTSHLDRIMKRTLRRGRVIAE